MTFPIFVVTDWKALPGGDLEASIPDAYEDHVINKRLPAIFSLNTRFRKDAEAKDLASIGVLGQIRHISKKSTGFAGTFQLLNPVRLKDIQAIDGKFWSQYELSKDETINSITDELVTDRAKGVFAEFLRRIRAPLDPRWQAIRAETNPSVLLNMVLQAYSTAKGERNMGYKYFSCFDKQKLLEIDSAEKRLGAFTAQLCERIGCEVDSPSVQFDPSDPYWSFSRDDLAFKNLGSFHAEHAIAIGCPSRLGTERSEIGTLLLPITPGDWFVYKTEIPASFTQWPDQELDYVAYVITQNSPTSDWEQVVSFIGEETLEVSRGLILAGSHELLSNEDIIDEAIESASDGLQAILHMERTNRYLCIETLGDGGFPVKVIQNPAGLLEMAIVYREKV